MSKFCENCGAEMDENDVVCNNCAPKAEEPAVEPATEATATTEATSNTAKKDTKKLAIIGGAIAAVVLVIVFLIFSLVGGKYKAPIKNIVKGMNKSDAKVFLKAYPDFLKMDKTYDDDKLKDQKKDMEKEYGDNVKYSCKILKKEKIEKDDLKHVEEYVKDTYDEDVKIKKGYELKVEEKYKGKDDFDYATTTKYVYKIDGKWKVLSVSPEYAKKSNK